MNGWNRLSTRLRVLFSKEAEERELDNEIRYHLDMEARQLESVGLDAAEARRRARIAFGGVERFKEEVRDARGGRFLDDLRQDLRLALRSLPKQPAFLIAVLATLSLGIGGNVAMVDLLGASIFGSLPYPDADRLVFGRVTFDGDIGWTVSGPDYFDTREQTETLSNLAAVTPFVLGVTLSGAGDPERVRSPLVSTNLFETLGVEPLLGRSFDPEEGELGANAVAVLEHGYWLRRFAGDQTIIGQPLNLDGTVHTVIGVMPAGFRFLIDADVWRPLQRDGDWAQARQFHNFVLVGRLAPGVDRSAAQEEIDVISQRLAELHPASNQGKGIALAPLQETLVEDYRTPLLLLTGAVGLLLLVACANVAGLVLARGDGRRPELAVRSILGASRDRLGRQLLTENAVLALGAIPLGLVLAVWLQRGILGWIHLDRLGTFAVEMSLSMVGVAAALSIMTLGLFGALPALRQAGAEPADELRDGVRTTDRKRATTARNGLVIAQVALTVVLLVSAGLLLRSFAELRGVDAGFATENLLTAEVQLPSRSYSDLPRRAQLFSQLQERVATIPGVEKVGLVSLLPIRDSGNNVRVARPEQWHESGSGQDAFQRMVLPGYFDAMGVRWIAGRDVSPADNRDRPNVVILSESLAATIFPEILPEGRPIGRTIGVDVGDDEPWLAEVIGVVGDVAPTSLAQGMSSSMYFSYYQRSPSSMKLAIRTSVAANGIVEAVRAELYRLDSDIPLSGVATMEEVLESSLAGRRAIMTLLAGFAVVALLLSGVGLYGVLAYQVSRRHHEIGVRLALGASPGEVAAWTLRGGLRLVALGMVLGLPIAYLAARGVSSLLFGVGTVDPLTYLAVVGFLVVVGSAACLLPARRAARVDPVEAFRVQ